MCEVDTSCTLSAHEFYKKYHVKEKCSNIFEEIGDELHDNLGVKKKPSKPSIPIDLAIKEPPKSHEELTKFLQEHLRLSNLKFVSQDDQKELADTLTMAIISIWPEHRKQGSDPFLSEIGNIELQRRITVYIVQTAEELFYEYIARAQEVNEKAVFSAEANLSRLKTQILHEANMCLNALKVRRKLAGHMRHVADEQWLKKGDHSRGRMLQDDVVHLDSKMKLRLEKGHQQFAKRQIDEINTHLKNINMSLNTLSYIDVNNERHLDISIETINEDVDDESVNSVVTSTSTKNSCEGSEETLVTSLREGPFIHHSSSMPNLQADAESKEEFGELNVVQSGRTRSVDQLLDKLLQDKKYVNVKLEEASSKAKEDLHIEELDDDFSPLLQVQETKQKRKNHASQSVIMSEDEEEDLFTDITNEVEDGEKLSSYKHLSQPSFVNVKVPGKGIVRISDSSISTRINESVLTLHKYPTMYNEFLEEIDDATVKYLDEHLFAGKQAQEVYDEITKTMSKDFLCFDKDDFVERCAPSTLDTSSLFMSALLQERQKAHLINDELRIVTEPPWSKFNSNDDWRNHPRFGGLGREEILQLQAKSKESNDVYTINKNISFPKNTTTNTANAATTATVEVVPANTNSYISTTTTTGTAAAATTTNFNTAPSMTHIQKSYSAWLSWYKTHLDTDDYNKFLCKKENDHLCQLFHLYDSEDSEGEEEEDLYNKCLEMQILEQQQRHKEEIRLQKKRYEAGYWNTQCVVLGGLGKDPDLSNMELIQNGDETEKVNDDEEVPTDICLQERLERIWKLLKVPEQYRVDMAMKYSDIAGTERLPEAIECWENVTDFIIERENLMGTLECFERSASDPNRFFQKGPTGSSVARINEAKTREKLIKAIKTLEEDINAKLALILKQFGDVVTYQGRIYSQKLQTDRVEMLYWLQQERREHALNCNTAEITGVTSVKCVNMTPTIT